MTELEQTKRLGYIARCLITDLRDVYAEECLGRTINEERAMQLILDAFEQAAPILTYTPPVISTCPYCHLPVSDYMQHAMNTCEVIDMAVKHLATD